MNGTERAKKVKTPSPQSRYMIPPTTTEAVVTASMMVTNSRTLAYTQKR